MSKELFVWEETKEKEQAKDICLNAFFEILRLFEIKQVEDMFTRDLIVKMTPIELKDNSDKLLWFNIFVRYREKILELL